MKFQYNSPLNVLLVLHGTCKGSRRFQNKFLSCFVNDTSTDAITSLLEWRWRFIFNFASTLIKKTNHVYLLTIKKNWSNNFPSSFLSTKIAMFWKKQSLSILTHGFLCLWKPEYFHLNECCFTSGSQKYTFHNNNMP